MKKLFFPFCLLTTFFLGSCAKGTQKVSTPSTNSQSFPAKISASEAKQMMEDLQECILLDVRSQAEYDEQHIEGALLLPDDQLAKQAESALPNKTTTIIVYCRSGRRSAGAATALVKMGYTSVYDMGGIIDWPYNTVKS